VEVPGSQVEEPEVNKKSLAAVSLVGAIPAGVLAFYCIHAFLTYSERMHWLMQVVNGITLLMAVILILTPVVIMLRKGKEGGAAARKGAEVAAPVAAGSSGEIDADPFELDEAMGDEAQDEFDVEATDEEADLFEFDDEK
jgi:hypothetical protein